tara:strand:- start:1561 stop:1770 length:210 start_codon:yes stop_codon:yes gene_type:complete
MIEITYLLIGSLIFYGIIYLTAETLKELKSRKYDLIEPRNTEERQIAGEETSEVALNYLQSAEKTKESP